MGYAEGLRLQERAVRARRDGDGPDRFLFLEHDPVVTLGRGAHAENLLLDRAGLAARGIELHESGRGGDVTYHGPGQLVGYPIVALAGERRDAHRYLRDLEEALIRAVAVWGIRAARSPGWTGIWVGDEKLAAIGVRLSSGWIASHGFALNVAGPLDGFSAIVPCGIRDRGVTSIERLTGRAPDLREVAEAVAVPLAESLGRRLVWEDDPGAAAGAADPARAAGARYPEGSEDP